jgi:hypothetical protein
MKRAFFAGAAVVWLIGSTLTCSAYADDAGSPKEMHGRWQNIQEARLDARLAGLKAGLKLTADEERNWAAVESAVRAIAKAQSDRRHAWREHWKDAEQRPSPIDRLRAISDRLAARSADMKALADAVMPLYASLDDQQKQVFAAVFHDFVRHAEHHRRRGDDGR